MNHFDSNNPERQQNAIVRAVVLACRAEHGDEKVSALFSKPKKPLRLKPMSSSISIFRLQLKQKNPKPNAATITDTKTVTNHQTHEQANIDSKHFPVQTPTRNPPQTLNDDPV